MNLTLSLAGVPVAVRLEGAVNPLHVEARFGAYEVRDAPRDAWSLDVTVEPGWRPARDPVTEYPGVDVARGDDGAVVFTRATDETRVDPSSKRVTVRARPPRAALDPIEAVTAIDTPLRLWLSYVLPRLDGVLVHASGYGDDRGAVIFPAVSGGGKTTLARKLPHEHVLSDDLVALRREDGRWFAHATPFVGEYRRATRPRRCPLRAIASPEKSDVTSLEPMRAPVALARLARCAVYFVRGDGVGARVLDHVASALDAAPAYRLRITRDAPAMPVVDQLLG